VTVALIGCLALSNLPAQSLREPAFMAKANPGFNDIYNLDYARAEQVFVKLRQEYPNHPAPPLYLAITAWLRELFRRQDLDLDLFLSPSFFTKATNQVMPPDQYKMFADNMERCHSLAQKILDGNPQNQDALYFLGAAHGILAAYSMTIDRNLRKAFSYGNKAYDLDRQVYRINSNYFDAYMTLGLYEYIVGSIPWYLKFLAAIVGYRGTKDQGFRYIDLAVNKGDYVKTDAKILQMVLRIYENRPKEALIDAQELHRDFPHNFIFQINMGQIFEALHQSDKAVDEYLDVVRKAEQKQPNYHLLALDTFRYTLGYKLFKIGRLDAAEEQFRKSLASATTPERERVLSQLRLGQTLDLRGKRAEALEQYQAVLKLKDFEDAQDQARKYILKPFRS
jgi:tetratricopeptide (TPR) repeat protein